MPDSQTIRLAFHHSPALRLLNPRKLVFSLGLLFKGGFKQVHYKGSYNRWSIRQTDYCRNPTGLKVFAFAEHCLQRHEAWKRVAGQQLPHSTHRLRTEQIPKPRFQGEFMRIPSLPVSWGVVQQASDIRERCLRRGLHSVWNADWQPSLLPVEPAEPFSEHKKQYQKIN